VASRIPASSKATRRRILETGAVLAATTSLGLGIGRAAAQPRRAAGPTQGSIDGALRRGVAAQEVGGVVGMAANDRGIFHEGAFGTRDLAKGPEMTPDTIFRPSRNSCISDPDSRRAMSPPSAPALDALRSSV
jgi:hypothetical protein